MWSMHPTPDLKPACSFLKMVLVASLSLIWMILQKILLGTERSVNYSPPVCALCPIPLLGELNDQSPPPVFRYDHGIPDFME